MNKIEQASESKMRIKQEITDLNTLEKTKLKLLKWFHQKLKKLNAQILTRLELLVQCDIDSFPFRTDRESLSICIANSCIGDSIHSQCSIHNTQYIVTSRGISRYRHRVCVISCYNNQGVFYIG